LEQRGYLIKIKVYGNEEGNANMIKRLSHIKNLGQFENFKSQQELEKNNILFGFNGAGKSTLSDLFYSMVMGRDGQFLDRRRTLSREGEDERKEISAELEGEAEEKYTFSETGWNNRPDKVFVFNEQYVTEHVFVSRQVHGDVMPMAMGREGSRLMRQRDLALQENENLTREINDEITKISDAGIKIKDFTSTRLTARTSIKRFEKMSTMELFPLSEKDKIEQRIKENEKYFVEINVLEQCNELYDSIGGVQLFSVSSVLKKMKKVPQISSKELMFFLRETLTSVDIKWAVRGYANQKERNKCPMCGQEIRDKAAIEFFDKLGKYVSQNKGEKIQEFSTELYQIAASLQNVNIRRKITLFCEIINLLNDNKLLLKRDTNRLKYGLGWTKEQSGVLEGLIKKIYEKAENPYIDIEVSKEENDVITLLNAVLKNIQILRSILEEVNIRVQMKNDKRLETSEVGKLYDLSYGPFRACAEIIKSKSMQYIRNINRINELNQNIDDCYNQSRLISVNDFLQKLNTHIKIEVHHNRYYVKLKDFKSKELLGDKETIFSEGEHRAVAFAYFLSEISNLEQGNANRTIIIDDPISSMDLSRKSIISHHIADMMNNENWQVIVMTHDIGFIERVVSYLDSKTTCKLMELRSGKADFIPLNIKDYLSNDESIYREFIENAETDSIELSKIIAFMSLRPFAYVCNVSEEDYKKVEKASTFFAHTLYSKSGRIGFREKDYNAAKLRAYIKLVNKVTKSKFDETKIVEEYSFKGFDFEKLTMLYSSIPIDSMTNLRKKAMLLRPLIEACFFQFSQKAKFDPEHIGTMYMNTIRSNGSNPVRKQICLDLKTLYDATKKYHHGAEGGSLLGISWINPNEVEYFDEVIQRIITKIRDNGMIREISA